MTDLIKQVGGIEKAKEILSKAPIDCDAYETETHVIELGDLRQAIADYNTDHCSDIINHVSPSTQVYEK